MEIALINIQIIFIIFIFSNIVSTIIHEIGHYSFARLFKIVPTEFIVGTNKPCLKKLNRYWEFKKLGTHFMINPFAFGGYVDGKECLEKLSKLKMISVAFAGPFFNLLLALVLIYFSIFFDSINDNVSLLKDFLRNFMTISMLDYNIFILCVLSMLISVNIIMFFANLFTREGYDGYLIWHRFRDTLNENELNEDLRNNLCERN